MFRADYLRRRMRPSRNDARDKSRSLGFSPGTNFASPVKFRVFLDGWGREIGRAHV